MMHITVVYCPGPRELHQWSLQLAPGAVVAQALNAARAQWPEGVAQWPEPASVGIWGRRQGADAVLRDGDRVEVYRDLRVDPKVARRERFNRQGVGTAGLFARKRPGAKQGY